MPSKPRWLRKSLPTEQAVSVYSRVEGVLSRSKLHTVCSEAKCPNRGECWGSGTATFLLMGDICTRNCRFCSTKTGSPGKLEPDEPMRVAEVSRELGLTYVVLTSVDRDDLPDCGSGHFANCIARLKQTLPGILVEALVPDFSGSREGIRKIISSGVDVFAHNLEVVEELQEIARDHRASYSQSLAVLGAAKELKPETITKSSLMVGLGESKEQVSRAMDDLREAKVDLLTLGQYLQPSRKSLEVREFVTPGQFNDYKKLALEMGFKGVVSGPFVRSSYQARELFYSASMRK